MFNIQKHFVMQNKECKNMLISYTMDVNECLEVAKTLKKCKFGMSLIARGGVTLQAPKATAREFMLQFGYAMPNFTKVSYVTNVRASDYERSINKKLTANGSEANFEAQKASGVTWDEPYNGVTCTSDKTGERMIKICNVIDGRTKTQCRYIADGIRFATEEEAAFIKGHQRQQGASKKQQACGLDERECYAVRQYKVCNIVAIGKNDIVKAIWLNNL